MIGVVGASGVIGIGGDTDAGADIHFAVADIDRFAKLVEYPVRSPFQIVDVVDLRDHDGELVAAQTRHQIGGPDTSAQASGDFLEQQITGRMTIGVVDGLETG